MRKWWWLAALAVCVAQAAPVVRNAGFEEGGEALVGWDVTQGEGGTGSWSWDTAQPHGGQRAVRVKKTNAAGFSILTGGLFAVDGGTDWLVRGQVRLHGESRCRVYYMLGQYTAASDDPRLPNVFGPTIPLEPSPGWQLLEQPIHLLPGSTRLRIQVVLAGAPCEVSFDDFEVVPAAAGTTVYHPRYEKAPPEPLPPLEPARQRLAARQPARGQVTMAGGRPRFIIDGRPTPACFYVGAFHQPNAVQIRDFRDAGVHVYLMPLVLGRGVYGQRGPWSGPGKTDFAEIDDLLMRVLRVDPDGYVIFYMGTDPYPQWGAEHPTEVACDDQGRKAVVGMHPQSFDREPKPGERYGPSLVSSVLRQETGEVLRQLVRHVKSLPAGKAVLGYHVAGLNDGQFFAWSLPGHLTDYSEAARRAWKLWLEERYHHQVAELRAAWGQPAVTFETAALASQQRRMQPGFLLTAPTDTDVADTERFCSEGTIDTIAGYAKILKEETGRQALVSTYYEDAASAVPSHLALGRLLQCPDIDFMCGPTAYGVRSPGDPGECHSTWGSVALHQRIWLSEQDYRSWLSGPVDAGYDRSVGRAKNATDHNNMVRRESGMMLAFGHGTWWYDMDGGWFRDDGIMKGVAEAQRAFASDLTNPEPSYADLAVFIDERSLDYLGGQSKPQVMYHSVLNVLYTLNQAAVPYHLYLQSDLPNPALPAHKAYLFLNAYHLSAAERQAVEGLKQGGRTLLFAHAPGVIGAPDAAAEIRQLTGIGVSALGPGLLQAVPAPAMAATLGEAETLSTSGLTGPRFAVTDPAATVIGNYPTGEPAVAVRRHDGWNAVFFGALGPSDVALNRLARWAGCWVVSNAGDAVFANRRYLTIHAMYGGPKTLRLAAPSRVVDLTSGQEFAARTDTVKLTMKRGETRWFALTP